MAINPALREPVIPHGFNLPALWRLTGWGLAAALSLAVLAVITQTHTGSKRLQMALAPAELPDHPVAVVNLPPPASATELARVQAELRALTVDRDRLAERVATVEHSLDDLTGSIKKLAEAKAAEPPPAKPAPPPTIAAPQVTAAPSAPAQEQPAGETAAAPAQGELRNGATAEPAPQHKADETTAAHPAEPAAPAAEAAAPSHVDVPLPPVRMAALPPKPEFGIALAGATSVALLHMQWAALEANFAPLLGALKPHVLRERRGTRAHYRLVVGPLPTYTAAAKLCARLIRARAVCHPVKMAGEPL